MDNTNQTSDNQSTPITSSQPPQNFCSNNNKGLMGFLSQTKKRFFSAISPPIYPHSPSCSLKNEGKGNNNNLITTLNFPFKPVSPSNVSASEKMDTGDDAFIDSGDIELLESKVTDMEITVKAILVNDSLDNKICNTTPKNPNSDCKNSKGNISLEGLDEIFYPTTSCGSRLPADLYHELIAIYETQLVSDLGTNSTKQPSSPLSNQNCQNKDKNLRAEVLKWNKD